MILKKLRLLQVKRKKTKAKLKTKNRNFFVILTLFLFFSLVFLFIFWLAYFLAFLNRIYPFVRIVSVNIGGKTPKEAELILSQLIFQTFQNRPYLVLNYENQQFFLNPEEIKFRYLTEKTIKEAYQIGRHQGFLKNLHQQALAFWQRIDLPLSYQLDESLLTAKIASWAAEIEQPAISPSILVLDQLTSQNQEKIIVNQGKPGLQLDRQLTQNLILQRWEKLDNQPLKLPNKVIFPQVSEEKIQETKNRAYKLLNKKIILNYKNDQWEISEKELINFLSFYQDWEKEKIATYVSGLALSINRPPQDALFHFENGKVLEFKPSQEGNSLDETKTQNLLLEALQVLEKDDLLVIKINLPVNLIKPKITTEAVNSLGIKELIGEGNSWFYGSIAGRIHNIQLAAAKINGLLVSPNEVFSFNQAVGDISAATGFKPAYIIQGNRTILGDGGGVCQVSTTLFRAALNAGLPIEERHPHAYRVAYYEYHSDPGFDATVYYPTEDLKFKNDTPAYLLIQSEIILSQSKLTFKLYGSHDGRQVKFSPVRIWDQVAPPPDLYQDDPTLPLGVIKQVDWKAWGAKVAFDWQVSRGQEILQEKTFYSYYRPWQAIFLKGTKQ